MMYSIIITAVIITIAFFAFKVTSTLMTKRCLIASYKIMLARFMLKFKVFHGILEKELKFEEMFEESFNEGSIGEQFYDMVHDIIKHGYFQFDIGNNHYVEVHDTKELRQAFIIAGDFLINTEEELNVMYSVSLDDETQEIYNMFLICSKYLRKICLAKNESAVAEEFNLELKSGNSPV